MPKLASKASSNRDGAADPSRGECQRSVEALEIQSGESEYELESPKKDSKLLNFGTVSQPVLAMSCRVYDRGGHSLRDGVLAWHSAVRPPCSMPHHPIALVAREAWRHMRPPAISIACGTASSGHIMEQPL